MYKISFIYICQCHYRHCSCDHDAVDGGREDFFTLPSQAAVPINAATQRPAVEQQRLLSASGADALSQAVRDLTNARPPFDLCATTLRDLHVYVYINKNPKLLNLQNFQKYKK